MTVVYFFYETMVNGRITSLRILWDRISQESDFNLLYTGVPGKNDTFRIQIKPVPLNSTFQTGGVFIKDKWDK